MRPFTYAAAAFTSGSPRALALVLLAALAVAGCSERDEAGAAGDGEARVGGTLVVAGGHDLDAANPLVSQEAKTQEINQYLLFMPLLQYDEDLEFKPYLAESWDMDGEAVTFHLRDDVRWHDGVPTTAYDVAFTYDRAKDPETAFANAEYFERWGEAEVIDSFTIRIGYEPHADPLASWPFLPIAPRHLLDTVPPANLRRADFNRSPVGNGPFRFVDYQPNDRWVFEANPEFPAELGGRPNLDRLIWRIIPENAAQATEVRAGNVDVALVPGAANFPELSRSPGLRGLVKPTRQFAFLGWNGQHPALGDARVRRALAMAIDRESILEGLRGGYGEVGVGPIGSFHWAYDEDLEPLPYDTAAARALLAEAGYRDRNGDGSLEGPGGEDLRIGLKYPAANQFNSDIAELVRGNLAAIGVTVEPRATEFGTLIQDISTPARNFDAVIMGWNSDFRINLRAMFHSEERGGPFQMASYSNPRVDRLIDRTALEPDRDEALPLYHELQRVLREEQPWTVLYYQPELIILRDRVRGVEMDIRGVFVNVRDWWVAAPRQQDSADTAAQ